jgi:hypothetical protein
MRASIQQLRSFAEYVEYKLPLSSEKLRVLAEEGDIENDVQPLLIAHLSEETDMYAHQYIYGPYRSEVPEDMYSSELSMNHPFCAPVRLRLTQQMIETLTLSERKKSSVTNMTRRQSLRDQLGKENSSLATKEFHLFDSDEHSHGLLTLRQQLLTGNILAFFPLHNNNKLERLRRSCLGWTTLPWQVPTNKLALYFGEKIALYFDFIGHYSLSLLIPSVLGLPIQAFILWTGNFSTYYQVAFAAIVLMWGIVMLESWKRKESMIALKRGMSEFEEKELDRPGKFYNIYNVFIFCIIFYWFYCINRRNKCACTLAYIHTD